MNRSLIEGDPHALLEGLLTTAYAIGSSHGYIYIRTEYALAYARLTKAISQMREYGLIGTNILGSGFDFDITVKRGAGAYVCGEETALMASIEGRRGMPRSRPPFPAVSGLHKKPSIIQNVETLGTVPNIMRNGAAWYRQMGVPDNAGTKTFALVGKIRRPGLIEVPLGTSLRKIIYDIGGGTRKPFKAIQTGGPSGGCLSEEFLDTPVDYESLKTTGSIMGAGGLIVLDAESCVVDLTLYFLEFALNESCGKCSPCRVGTRHMVEMLRDITRRRAEPDKLVKLQTLAESILKGSLCGLGQSSPNMVLTTLRYFRNEYLQHIKSNYCAAAVCPQLIEFNILPDKCTGCQQCEDVCPTNAITGRRSEPHLLDQKKCIKCRACFEICRFDPLAGDAIIIKSKGNSNVE
jgi:NADH:ubiquinone oxidoreductase subunit F (NADH-binding)/NAD-dependent dihydropyrimidine dehydrogenase PreA subunit